jgi:hypothetical protein
MRDATRHWQHCGLARRRKLPRCRMRRRALHGSNCDRGERCAAPCRARDGSRLSRRRRCRPGGDRTGARTACVRRRPRTRSYGRRRRGLHYRRGRLRSYCARCDCLGRFAVNRRHDQRDSRQAPYRQRSPEHPSARPTREGDRRGPRRRTLIECGKARRRSCAAPASAPVGIALPRCEKMRPRTLTTEHDAISVGKRISRY